MPCSGGASREQRLVQARSHININISSGDDNNVNFITIRSCPGSFVNPGRLSSSLRDLMTMMTITMAVVMRVANNDEYTMMRRGKATMIVMTTLTMTMFFAIIASAPPPMHQTKESGAVYAPRRRFGCGTGSAGGEVYTPRWLRGFRPAGKVYVPRVYAPRGPRLPREASRTGMRSTARTREPRSTPRLLRASPLARDPAAAAPSAAAPSGAAAPSAAAPSAAAPSPASWYLCPGGKGKRVFQSSRGRP